MRTKVSVIMAVYNGERYLEGAISSVLRQTFADFEFIVIDDGSSDATPEILSRIGREDSRIVVVRQENRGQTLSLNRAVELARGNYLARQDADDLSMAERLELQARYLDTHPSVAVLGTAAQVMDQKGAVIGNLSTPQGAAQVRDALLTVRATPVHGSVMMRKEAFAAVGGYRDAFWVSQDFDLWLRMAERFDLDNLPSVLYRWRRNPAGVYVTRRALQLKYSGVALAFARERALYSEDSYELLRLSRGDLDAFAEDYRMRGLLHSLWGELLFRGLQSPQLARSHFVSALRSGFVRPKTLALLGLSLFGFAWPGSASLPAS